MSPRAFFCVHSGGVVAAPPVVSCSSYLQVSACVIFFFFCICLSLYSNSPPPVFATVTGWSCGRCCVLGVSGNVSIGYKVQGFKPCWSSSKNPPIWQHVEFSSHPSGCQWSLDCSLLVSIWWPDLTLWEQHRANALWARCLLGQVLGSAAEFPGGGMGGAPLCASSRHWTQGRWLFGEGFLSFCPKTLPLIPLDILKSPAKHKGSTYPRWRGSIQWNYSFFSSDFKPVLLHVYH